MSQLCFTKLSNNKNIFLWYSIYVKLKNLINYNQVNLSETSLDVFQLLLQLSDTMLELNSQLASGGSSLAPASSQMLFLNHYLNSNLNLNNTDFLYDHDRDTLYANGNYLSAEDNPVLIKPIKIKTNTRSNMIEEFLHRTLNSVQSSAASKADNAEVSVSSPVKNPYASLTATASSHMISKFHKQSASLTPSKSLSNENLSENVYDKTSVTQFVASLLNGGGDKASSFNEVDRNSGYYSLMSTLNNQNEYLTEENLYQCIDEDMLAKVDSSSAKPVCLVISFVFTTQLNNK